MRETDQYYFFWKHQFGQWTKRDIVSCSGITYNCCEQFMMHQKALLFGDIETANKILKEDDPSSQQKLGRLVKGYVAESWDKNRFGVVWMGNYLKFTQHSDLAQRLIATGDRILAEASPSDLVWGVGFKADDDRILDQQNWKGQNLLGKVLMSVRSAIQEFEGVR